jgi:hypothetical protein
MESNESRGERAYQGSYSYNNYNYGESAGESETYYHPSVNSSKTEELEREIKNLQEQLRLQRELDEIENKREAILTKIQKYRK